MNRTSVAVATLWVCLAMFPLATYSQSVATTGDAPVTTMGTIVVTGEPPQDASGAIRIGRESLAGQRANTSDTARLLEDTPGVSTYGAGGISSLPVVRGLADDRLRTTVDGMDLMSACPNHMNPALSFIDPSKVASVVVFAGISPVSAGGDSIGGAIQVKSGPPKFAKPDGDLLFSGQAGVFSRSNGNGRGWNAGMTVAGERMSLSYGESTSESDNYWAAADFKLPGIWKSLGVRQLSEHEVGASEYAGSKNRELGIALSFSAAHLLELSVSEQRLDYEGFPNQRMDMVASAPVPGVPGAYAVNKGVPSNVNRTTNLRYTGQFGWGELQASLFRQDLRHHMDMLQDRMFGMLMPMDTEASTVGGALKASIELSDRDLLRVGGDFQNYRLDDWWPPIGLFPGAMCCGDFWNIRDGRRDRAFLFAEWEAQWNRNWLSQLGVRVGRVTTDAGTVQGYSAVYAGDAAVFNARDRRHRDDHLDLTALARYTPDTMQSYEAGIARKTRSPSLYERYPWSYNSMPALMNNFVGDGNAYIGNPDLKPEVAYTLSASGDWHAEDNEQWSLKLTGHLTYVQDYIDTQRCTPAMNAQCPAGNATSTNGYVKLRYVNQSARLYGIDLAGKFELGRIDGVGNFSVSATASFLRGENRSTGDNLYHIMPLNSKLALNHVRGDWTNTLEVQVVEGKDRISQVRNEVATPDYTLVNLRTSHDWKHARLDIALENALNTFYLLPLGGAYVGQGNAMTINGIPWGMVVPGKARSLNVSLNLRF